MATRRRWKRTAGKTRPRSRRIRAQAPEDVRDPIEAAQAAGLRYVSDTTPGIRRKRAGTGFSYVGPEGKTVKDAALLARIRSLAIPPAYTDVWIRSSHTGHIQATGRDARGRKQYRYHAKWREARDETKFGRVLAFSEALPRMRRRVEQDLSKQGLPSEKVLATVVRLLDCTGIRIGNDEYARANRSFGLTTLQDRHVEISGSNIRFDFKGKSGKNHSVSLNDRRLARIVQRCQDIPAEDLFQYIDEEGVRQTISSGDVNDYLRDIAGHDFTAKELSHLVRNQAGGGRLSRDRRVDFSSPGQTEHPPRDRARGRPTQQHAGRVPEVLHPPRCTRCLHCRHDAEDPSEWNETGREDRAGARRGSRSLAP